MLNGQKVPIDVVFSWETVDQLRRFLNQAPPADDETWMSAAKAAQYLDCPRSRIYALTHRHAIPFRKEGSRLLFKRSLLDVWVSENCPATRPGRVAR
jgi:excisionase family DNA binding protein